ncbi:HNH endonuclease signature motif containing protein [Nonomuraea endophytica]|uniref:HNH endonuclease signature motif containing protein n=1 Tax=Nonomuraea endophytica TaxID=714136 RepID=UPI0037CC9D94
MSTTPFETARFYALIYRVPVGTIYRWASEDGWRRTDPARRPVRYHPDDVDQSFVRREPTRPEVVEHQQAAQTRKARADRQRRSGAERSFWQRVERTSGCWIWLGPIMENGYGRTVWLGVHQLPHRVAYELAVGPIPLGREIDHACANTRCVRPDHLQAVTRVENQRLARLRRARPVDI